MLPGDSRSAWDSHILDDPRAVSLWDGERIAGTWVGDHTIGGLGGGGGYPVWDAYLAFRSSARWQNTPTEVVASGSPIIDHTGGLDDRFVPLLEGR
jgi:hypothetical protein